MFGYKIIKESEYKQLKESKEIFFSPSQDYASVNEAIITQISKFTAHEKALVNYVHKLCDAIEQEFGHDSDKTTKMISSIGYVVNKRM
jgi:hypothetical protein